MNWPTARALAQAGTPIRRAGWNAQWLTFNRNFWFLAPYNAQTGQSSDPVIVQWTQWTAAEFQATDWTIDAIPKATVVGTVGNSTTQIVIVPAKACLFFAYAPFGYTMPLQPTLDSIGLQEMSNGGNVPADSQTVSAPVIIPISSWVNTLSITATGAWFWGPWGSTPTPACNADGAQVDLTGTIIGPPDGGGNPYWTHWSYFTAALNSQSIRWPAALTGTPGVAYNDAIARAAANDPFGIPFHNQQLVGMWINSRKTGPIFVVGSNLAGINVPRDATGLALGFMGNWGWSHFSGSVTATVTFAA